MDEDPIAGGKRKRRNWIGKWSRAVRRIRNGVLMFSCTVTALEGTARLLDLF